MKYLLYIWTVPFNDRKEHFNNKTQLGVKIGYTKNTKKMVKNYIETQNELELEHQLKVYLELNLQGFKSDLSREENDYYFGMKNNKWLPENIVRVKNKINLLKKKVEFYQTQLDNLNNK